MFMYLLTLLRPSKRSIDCAFDFSPRSLRRRTFIEAHDHICAEFVLDDCCLFWSEEVETSIQVIPKFHAAVINDGSMTEREDLVSTGICENWFLPSNEFVEPSGLFHNLHSRSKGEVVGVAEEDLALKLQEFPVADAAHGTSGCDWHEERSFYCSMCSDKSSTSAKRRFFLQGKHRLRVARISDF